MNLPHHPTPPHDDGLQELRDIRHRLLAQCGGDLQRLGDHYRGNEAQHQEKVRDPRKLLTAAVRAEALPAG